MILRCSPTRFFAIAGICLLSSLSLAALYPAIATAADTDKPVDHSAQNQSDQDHSNHATHESNGDDPHAHHRAMMQQTTYQRSEHNYPLSALELVDMHDQDTDLLHALECDHPVMINFIFTTCTTICPIMSATFSQVQSELGSNADNVCMISFSIDPEYDTPTRLREYAQRFNASTQWRFYTGALDDMVAVQKAFDVYRGNKMNHEPTTLMRKSAGDPWLRIDGIASAADIVKEYKQLIAP